MAMRVTNLGLSGLDIEQEVQKLMKAQRVRHDKLYQLKTQLEWKKADYNTMYTAINDFRSKTVLNYTLESMLKPKQVVSSDETKVTATANADAVNFTHAVTVTDLAQSASMTSSAAISKVGSPGKTNLDDHIGVSGKIKLTISDGTTTKELENTTDGSGYDTTGKSIYDLVGDINKLGLNVKASYDATLDRFFLSNSKTGAAAQITLTSADGTGTGVGSLAEKLQLGSSATVTTDTAVPANNPAVFTTGENAVFNLDGVVGLTQSSNQFTISGVTYNLKALGAANVTVSSDTEKVVANVKAFVEAYNSMLSKLNAEVNEEKYKDFLPLTDEQKSEMKEADVKLWEAKAKSGLLHGNSILRDLVNKMRSAVSAPVSGLTGSYTSASNIGITTGGWQEGGKLYLNETKLREALEQDPEVVNKIFGTSVEGGSSSAQGVAVRIKNELTAASDKIVTEGGITASASYDFKSNIGKQIAAYNKRMSDMEDRLQRVEDAYYAKFTAMEKALSQLSKQQSWLAQQMGGE